MTVQFSSKFYPKPKRSNPRSSKYFGSKGLYKYSPNDPLPKPHPCKIVIVHEHKLQCGEKDHFNDDVRLVALLPLLLLLPLHYIVLQSSLPIDLSVCHVVSQSVYPSAVSVCCLFTSVADEYQLPLFSLIYILTLQSALHCCPHSDPPPRQRFHCQPSVTGSDLVATPAVCRSPAATPAKCVIFDSCGITWQGVTWHLSRRHWHLNARAGVLRHLCVCVDLTCDFCIVPLGVHFTQFVFDICTSGRRINQH